MDVKGDAQTVGQTLPDKAATHMLSSTSASTLIANRNGLLLVLRNLTLSHGTIFPSTYAVRMNAMGSGLLKKIVMTEGGGSSGVAHYILILSLIGSSMIKTCLHHYLFHLVHHVHHVHCYRLVRVDPRGPVVRGSLGVLAGPVSPVAPVRLLDLVGLVRPQDPENRHGHLDPLAQHVHGYRHGHRGH
jgi:hypothetical protein